MAIEFVHGVVEVTQRGDNVVVLNLVGEHDLSTVSFLERAINDYVAAGHGLIASLARAEFIDSSTLRALFYGDRLMRQRGRRLVLYSPPANRVDALLDISGVRQELLCCDTLTEAHAFARQGG